MSHEIYEVHNSKKKDFQIPKRIKEKILKRTDAYQNIENSNFDGINELLNGRFKDYSKISGLD